MSKSELNAFEKLQQPIELSESAFRHRAALITICTPVILMALYDLTPNELPLLSVAAAKNPHAFWLVMLTLILWAFLLYLVDLSFSFMERFSVAADVKQGVAYEPTVWMDDCGPNPNEREQRPPDDPEEFEKWGKRSEWWLNLRDKLEHWFQWLTRVWMPVAMGLISSLYCAYHVFCGV